MIKKLLLLGLLLCKQVDMYAVIAQGDHELTSSNQTTFSFSVGNAIFDPGGQRLWTLSGQDLSNQSLEVQSYGVSYTPLINIDGNAKTDTDEEIKLVAYPFIPDQAYTTFTINNQFHVDTQPITNPLLGNAFSGVTFLGSNLIAVMSSTPNYLYYLQSAVFYDGNHGKTNPQGVAVINKVNLDDDRHIAAVGTTTASVVFAANSTGVFGTDTSYISYLTPHNVSAKVADVDTQCVSLEKSGESTISVNSPQLTANTQSLSRFDDSVTIIPSLVKTEAYLGFDVTAGLQVGDCAVAMVSAYGITENNPRVAFSSVLPDAVAQQNIVTPISTTQGLRVAVRDMSSTTISSGLRYVIVSRFDGVGQQYIYAMPVVSYDSAEVNNGKIADFNSIRQEFNIVGSSYVKQDFDQVITDAEQINIASSSSAVTNRLVVGAGHPPLAPGQTIKQLVALGDNVYISIQDPFSSQTTPGMFQSQALLDAQGRIAGWTAWQRIAGTDDQVMFNMKDVYSDATIFVSGNTSNTIQQTTWNSTGDLSAFIDAIATDLSASASGVQNIFTVSSQTQGLAGTPCAIATGNNTAIIAQTGMLDSYNHIEIVNDPAKVITLDASSGLNIGSIVAATFAHVSSNNYNWLFLAGDNGLAVLSNDLTGIGFQGQLSSIQDLISVGQSCKTIGDFKFVKKLVSVGNNLYVLTSSAVYKIVLDPAKFTLIGAAALSPEIVVQADRNGAFAYCTDMIIDQNLMLLGTTQGMYALDLTNSLPAQPVAITIPGGLQAVTKLITIAPSGVYNQDFYTQSNLYVLTINAAVQQACLNRFTINNGVVAPIQDQLLEGQNGPLLVLNYMSNTMFIDGSFGFLTAYSMYNKPAMVEYMQYTLKSGISSTQSSNREFIQKYNLTILDKVPFGIIAGITRDYASGCLMLAGTFGLQTAS